jgi:NAD(P)-dependent dehydrogenase (short-subunit alcohol dehydrogenase family)
MLTNKISLITGATSGIGLACAEKLASLGSNLVTVHYESLVAPQMAIIFKDLAPARIECRPS